MNRLSYRSQIALSSKILHLSRMDDASLNSFILVASGFFLRPLEPKHGSVSQLVQQAFDWSRLVSLGSLL